MENSAEKLLRTTDIWEHIFQYFSLKEQLQLTQVCELFHHIISIYIWKRKYKELKLCLIDKDTIIVTDRIDEIDLYNNDYTDPMFKLGYGDYKIIDVDDRTSGVVLDYNELFTFLALAKNNIIKLQIIEKANIQLINSLMKHELKHLKTLIVHGVCGLNLNVVKDIRKSCPLVEILVLSNDNETPIEQGVLKDHNEVSEIASMKMLKTLLVRNNYVNYNINDLLCIISKLQLMQLMLNINFTIKNFDNAVDISIFNKQTNSCKLLYIKFDDPSRIITNQLLPNFEHLRVLTLGSYNHLIKINREVMENLIKSCKLLKSFCLTFCEFEDFIPLPSLETLTLINCTNIKRCNLISIFSETNLRSFTSIFSFFADNIETPFYIISPLEYLHIETSEYDFRVDLAKLLQYNSQNMKNLKTLIWHDYTMWYESDPLILYLPLKDAYYNLHSLFIDLNVVDLDDIMKMNYLKQLALIENDFSIDLFALLNIFNHPTLETFKFYTRNLMCMIKSPNNDLPNYKTRLRQIQIPLDMFDKAQHIWLRLLSENTKLHIACYYYEANSTDIYNYIYDLFTSKKVPDRIKSIKINEITIDCNSFQDNADTLKDLISDVQKYSNQFKEIMYFQF